MWRDLKRVVSLPNALTLIRLPLAGLLWARPSDPTWVLAIAVVGAATDAVDGRVARALRSRLPEATRAADTAVGAWLDPLCDKIFAASVIAVTAIFADVSLWLVALVLSRELLMAPLVAAYHVIPGVSEVLHFDFTAGKLGKLTTVFQFAFIAAVYLAPSLALPLAVASAITGVVATIHYVRRGISAARAAARRPA